MFQKNEWTRNDLVGPLAIRASGAISGALDLGRSRPRALGTLGAIAVGTGLGAGGKPSTLVTAGNSPSFLF